MEAHAKLISQPTTLRRYLEGLVRLRTGQLGFKGVDYRRPEGFLYDGMEDYVLKRGRSPWMAPLSNDEMAVVKAAYALAQEAGCGFRLKECYSNAWRLAVADQTGQIGYVEGYAIGNSIPCNHAWATINGKLIETTWRCNRDVPLADGKNGLVVEAWQPRWTGTWADAILGYAPRDWEYLGVQFDMEWLTGRVFANESVGSVLDDWENGWPALKGEAVEAA